MLDLTVEGSQRVLVFRKGLTGASLVCLGSIQQCNDHFGSVYADRDLQSITTSAQRAPLRIVLKCLFLGWFLAKRLLLQICSADALCNLRVFLLPGQSGLGKSTLMNTLFKSKVSRKSVLATAQEKIPKTVEIKSISHGMELTKHYT